MSSRTYLSIGDVLTLLREEFPDVTISKIRFLESQGLVNPERSPSGYRKFFEHDVERLRWVLRQQREHFLPLKVIRDRLADGDLGDDVGSGAAERQVGPPRPSGGSRRRCFGSRPRAADEGRRRGDGPHSRRCVAPGRPAAGREADACQDCRWSPKSRPRRVPRLSRQRRVTSQPRRRAVPPANDVPMPRRRWGVAPPGLRCLRHLRRHRPPRTAPTERRRANSRILP